MERGESWLCQSPGKLTWARFAGRKAPNAESNGKTRVVVPIDYIACEVQIQCGVPGEGEEKVCIGMQEGCVRCDTCSLARLSVSVVVL